MADLSSALKEAQLRKWFKESVKAGVPFCEYLSGKLDATLEGSETGDNRLIGSTANAGQSVTYAPAGDQPSSVGEWQEFLAECCKQCPLCIVPNPPTADDYVTCFLEAGLLDEPSGPVFAFRKSYLGMRC